MAGNLRNKTTKGVTENDYLRARKRVIRQSSVCAVCGEIIDKTLKPICRFVDTSGFSVADARDIPLVCGEGCTHQRKANPWSVSADHIVPVSELPVGSPLLADARNLRTTHLVCNVRRQAGSSAGVVRRVRSKDWYV